MILLLAQTIITSKAMLAPSLSDSPAGSTGLYTTEVDPSVAVTPDDMFVA